MILESADSILWVQHWTIVSEFPGLLGESPFWDHDEQALYWIDIADSSIRRSVAGERMKTWRVHSTPGCIAPRAAGGLAIALRDGIYMADRWGADLAKVAQLPYELSEFRANDGKAGPDGRFWVGTMYEPRDRRRAGLYSVDLSRGRDAEIWLQANNATVGNGLAWSPDGCVLYWGDTTDHVVRAWDWDSQANSMDNGRIFHEFRRKPAGWRPGDPGYGGRPDGAAVDVLGNYWCAMFEGGRIVQISPRGELIGEMAVPFLCPTMVCFGGDEMKTLYVTSSRQNRSTEELAAYPLSGHVVSTRVETPGLPVNRVC